MSRTIIDYDLIDDPIKTDLCNTPCEVLGTFA